ncbi:Hypothetical protein PHPALM_15509, partial [Phytophthora palmivora]
MRINPPFIHTKAKCQTPSSFSIMATKTVLSFEGERELVTEARAHELVQSYADAEAQPPAFTHITLRNKSYTLEAARVIAALFSRLE